MTRFLKDYRLHLLILTALVWLVFGRTPTSYFLADDFGEVRYVSEIAAGNLGKIWLNFTGNFMQIPGMAVWRPWLLISLLCDFLIWRTNAFGYYLTNVLSFNAVVLLYYGLLKVLGRRQGGGSKESKGSWGALLCASIFALSPLHCESVSWVVGRVDIICALFYLGALHMVLLADQSSATDTKRTSQYALLAALLFWLSIWTKEMSIGLAPIAFLLLFLFGSEPINFKKALRLTLPLWISLVLYFPLRMMALGTLLGGYVQGIGDSQAANALTRWLDADTWRRLFFPFAYSLYNDHPWPQMILAGAYLVLLTIFVLRMAGKRPPIALLTFIAAWAATALAPLYKLWGLGYELEGARFCFFVTMPLAALPMLILTADRKEEGAIEKEAQKIAAMACLLIALVYFQAARRTNLEWVHAGGEVRRFLKEAGELTTRAGLEQRKVILLGIPKRHGGAHMILNGPSLRVALNPPFTDSDKATNCLTYDPILFIENFHINTTALKKHTLERPILAGFVDGRLQIFDVLKAISHVKDVPPIQLPALSTPDKFSGLGLPYSQGHLKISAAQPLNLESIAYGDGLIFRGLQIEPFSVDYLAFTARGGDGSPLAPCKFQAEFPGGAANALHKTDERIYIPLSQSWQWYARPFINELTLTLPPGKNVQISDLKLHRAEEIQPQLSFADLSVNNDNFAVIKSSALNDGLALDVILPSDTAVRASKIKVEMTAANAFFDNLEDADQAGKYTEEFALSEENYRHNHVVVKAATKQLENSAAYHQIRVRLIDKRGRPVGPASCQLTFSVVE